MKQYLEIGFGLALITCIVICSVVFKLSFEVNVFISSLLLVSVLFLLNCFFLIKYKLIKKILVKFIISQLLLILLFILWIVIFFLLIGFIFIPPDVIIFNINFTRFIEKCVISLIYAGFISLYKIIILKLNETKIHTLRLISNFIINFIIFIVPLRFLFVFCIYILNEVIYYSKLIIKNDISTNLPSPPKEDVQ